MDKLAQELHLSRSELVEQIARGIIPLAKQKSLSEEFEFSPIQSLPLAKCGLAKGEALRDRLSEKMGAFLATDYDQFA